ncbi:unnamed protein product [Arabis nemorensis]|uniref:Uncharacterized protein n=1 Tax=Arabis nemorensis TaxID=586526 RepID=A0A565B9M1_9BRAS|nr:unnamed protein product [Arabis nemorensis]
MVPFRKRIQRRRKPIKETEFAVLGSMEECIEKMCSATGPYKGPDPFDAKGLVRYGHRGLVNYTCEKGFPCSAIVTVYARLGLHRYNFLNGTNYKLNRVKRYNQSTGPAASSYFITLVAHDPAAAASRRQTFQTRVNEQCYGKLNLTCSIARPRGDKSSCHTGNISKADRSLLWHMLTLSDCPPENPFEQLYKVNESELQGNDWIRLYMELAVATTDRNRYHLPNLKIVKVAMDGDGLNAKNAVFYIRYLDESRVGKDVDRIAIVRRAINDLSGCFSVIGHNQSAQGFFSRPPQIMAAKTRSIPICELDDQLST